MSLSPLSRLFNLLKLEKHDLKILPVLIFGYGLIGIATPIAVQAMVNIVSMGSMLQPLYIISLILFSLLLISGSLYVFESFIVELIQRRVFVRTATQTAQNTKEVELALYDSRDPAELVNRFLDVSTVQKSISVLLTTGLTSLIQIVIGSFVLIFYSAFFSLFIFIIVGFLIFILRSIGHHGTTTAIKESKAKYDTVSWLETIAKNIFAFKFYEGEKRVIKQTHEYVQLFIENRTKHFNILIWQNISAALIYAVAGTGLLALGGSLVIKGQLNLGQFVASELIIFGVLGALVRLVNMLDDFYDLMAALDKIGVIEDMPQESSGAHIIDEDITSIKLKSVDFVFDSHIQPLKNISFELQKGESLAVLGDSGSGKSTLLNLVTKFRAPSSGQITINQIDLRQLDNNALRNKMSFAKNIEIITGSILENICLGRDIPLPKVNSLITELGLADSLKFFPAGLDTPINDSGAPLSRKQLQLIMIARAIIASPQIMIIDDLLDSLNESEFDIMMKVLKQYKEEWILIVSTRFKHIAKHFDKTLNLN